jgi:hypothetical protein
MHTSVRHPGQELPTINAQPDGPGLPAGKALSYPKQVRQPRGPGIIHQRWRRRPPHFDRVSQPVIIAGADPHTVIHMTCSNNPTITNSSCRIRLI